MFLLKRLQRLKTSLPLQISGWFNFDRFPWILIYTIQEKVNCYIASLFEYSNNSFHCILKVEARLKKMRIQDGGKPERVQNAETFSFLAWFGWRSHIKWRNNSFKSLI